MKNLFIVILSLILLTSCQYFNPIIPQQSDVEMVDQQQQIPVRNEVPMLVTRNIDTQKADHKKVKVGLFFPFSGKNRDLGWSLYNSAVMSLFDNDINHHIELVLIDSKENAAEPTKSIKEIKDQNIKLIVGPIFSGSAQNIASDLSDNFITAISLSNNRQLSGKIKNNSGVFIAGFALEEQIDKIITYSLQNNKINFAILAPNNQYGITAANLFRHTVKVRDGLVITSEFYDPSGSDINKIVERIVNASITPQQLKTNKPNPLDIDDRTYPQVIFVADSGKMLGKIIDLIKEYNKNEREYQIATTSQLDDSTTLNNDGLIGIWLPAPKRERFTKFERSYYQTYSKLPPRIASIAYDSIAAIAELIDKKNGLLPSATDLIDYSNAKKNGFDGIDGTFRFLPNGLTQRNLAILQVGQDQFLTIDEPAEKFLKY